MRTHNKWGVSLKPKGRPKKTRLVKKDPKIKQFSPRGRPGRPDEIQLKTEELEALRLADYMQKDQKNAAKSMGISQQTFSRILIKARKIVADGLINGKIIKVEGGSYRLDSISVPDL